MFSMRRTFLKRATVFVNVIFPTERTMMAKALYTATTLEFRVCGRQRMNEKKKHCVKRDRDACSLHPMIYIESESVFVYSSTLSTRRRRRRRRMKYQLCMSRFVACTFIRSFLFFCVCLLVFVMELTTAGMQSNRADWKCTQFHKLVSFHCMQPCNQSDSMMATKGLLEKRR